MASIRRPSPAISRSRLSVISVRRMTTRSKLLIPWSSSLNVTLKTGRPRSRENEQYTVEAAGSVPAGIILVVGKSQAGRQAGLAPLPITSIMSTFERGLLPASVSDMADRLKNRIALITGAAGGIGSDMARLFSEEGALVIAVDILEEKVEAVAAEIRASGGQAVSVRTDVSVASEVDALFERVAAQYGGLDILVNNAIATDPDRTIVDLDEATWDKYIDVCLKGPFLCTRRALPLMKAGGGGSVVWMSSCNALFGVGETAYTAAKGGMISMARLVAAEYGAWKIRSNVICPGTISTENCMNYWNSFPAAFQRLKEMYPLGRIGTPREVSNLALFLASDESSFVTGGVYLVDGGLLAGRKFEVS